MIEQTAVVRKLEGHYAVVEVLRQSSCGQCNAKKGCGTGMLENSIGRRAMRMKAFNQCESRPGDEVIVAIPEKGFIKSAFFTYLLPLLMMLAGAVLAQQFATSSDWAYSDFSALVGAGMGFAIALLILKRYSLKLEKDEQLHPVVIRKTSPAIMVDLVRFQKEQQPF